MSSVGEMDGSQRKGLIELDQIGMDRSELIDRAESSKMDRAS